MTRSYPLDSPHVLKKVTVGDNDHGSKLPLYTVQVVDYALMGN